jgi:hypothetical protein
LCLSCHLSFGKPKKQTLRFSDFVRFYDFVLNRLNKTAVIEKEYVSRTTIWRKFKPFFSYSPTSFDSLFLLDRYFETKSHKTWVIGIDGKWLRRQGVIMIYRDVTNKVNLYWSYRPSESYDSIEKDFERFIPIIKNDLPKGIITDWKGALVYSVSIFLPPIPHQRCLSHVKRSLMRFLPLKSKILATQKLRRISQEIIKIENRADQILWKETLQSWINEYQSLLKEKTIGVNTKRKWWYTHGNLRRAVKLLTFDKKYLFVYLNHPFLPKTNNALEGSNSQIKGKLSNHRGMKAPQQATYIFWLLTFRRIKDHQDLKKLWDSLKNKIYRF